MGYTSKEVENLENQLNKHYGENVGVYHEVENDSVLHIDSVIYDTRIGNNEFYTVATIGMSKYTMEEAFDNYKNIELMICMPKTWDYNKDVWPINLLNLLAKFPVKTNTVLGPYHTIDLGQSIGNNEELKAVLIEFPRNYFPNETVFSLDEKTIAYLQVYPIYYKEMEEILKGNEKVIENIVECTIFDENRNCVC